jgi:hypothetical protein
MEALRPAQSSQRGISKVRFDGDHAELEFRPGSRSQAADRRILTDDRGQFSNHPGRDRRYAAEECSAAAVLSRLPKQSDPNLLVGFDTSDNAGIYASRLTSHQIAEVVYITTMFAFFNREGDAFDISPQGYLEMNSMTK